MLREKGRNLLQFTQLKDGRTYDLTPGLAQGSISLYHASSLHHFIMLASEATLKVTIVMGNLRPPEFPSHPSQIPLVSSYLSPSFPLSPPSSPPFSLLSFFPLSFLHFFFFLHLLPPTSCNEGFWNLINLLDSLHLLWDLEQVTRAPCFSVFSPVKQEKQSSCMS